MKMRFKEPDTVWIVWVNGPMMNEMEYRTIGSALAGGLSCGGLLQAVKGR